MSKHNNVNPGQYKVGGRLRPGEDNRPEEAKAQLKEETHELNEKSKGNHDRGRGSDDR